MAEGVEVVYSGARWRLLEEMRGEAGEMMSPLEASHIESLAYGSIARGDVSEDSDIDIFLPRPPASGIVEAVLERAGFQAVSREIVQATPSYAVKAYLYVGELRSYSFPLVELRTVERDFYSFAGSVGFRQVREGARVPGVDKRLMLIEPNEKGHLESPVQGREGVVAKMLGVDVAIVMERVRTLERRGRVGHTGVYIKRDLSPGESFGEVLRELSLRRPALRRRIRRTG